MTRVEQTPLPGHPGPDDMWKWYETSQLFELVYFRGAAVDSHGYTHELNYNLYSLTTTRPTK